MALLLLLAGFSLCAAPGTKEADDDSTDTSQEVLSTSSGEIGDDSGADADLDQGRDATHDAHPDEDPTSNEGAEQEWPLLRSWESATSMVHECIRRTSDRRTLDPGCDGAQLPGPVGSVHDSQVPDTFPLYACATNRWSDQFIYGYAACDGQTARIALLCLPMTKI